MAYNDVVGLIKMQFMKEIWEENFCKIASGFDMNNDFYDKYKEKYHDENYGDNDDEDKR